MAAILYYTVGSRCPCCPVVVCSPIKFIDSIDYQNDVFTCAAPGTPSRVHDMIHLTKPPGVRAAGYQGARKYERVYVGFDPGFETVTPVPDLSRFPHKCPRCGTSCYIGHGVEHAIGALDKTCR